MEASEVNNAILILKENKPIGLIGKRWCYQFDYSSLV